MIKSRQEYKLIILKKQIEKSRRQKLLNRRRKIELLKDKLKSLHKLSIAK